MGEIKSTLELIMEKTKGLTMSDEEKRALKQREVSAKVKGLVQRFLDGIINIERLRIEATAIGKNKEDLLRRVIIEESINRIVPGKNNKPILEILGIVNGMDIDPVTDILMNFEQKFEREKDASEKLLREKFEKRGISGSAVLPNLEVDPEWSRYVSEFRVATQEKLKDLLLSI
ncbi:MAG: hypothetical protein SV375_07340 [Thermodesulfobacteriota bacterium]|nr:hypothetical protein [Thermodesulfobacteriota bacterium]